MAAPPLTHHEILELVQPFTRRGRSIDLAATNRTERRLIFKSADRPGFTPDSPPIRERLQLESLGTGTCRLTRTLSRAAAPLATPMAGPVTAQLTVLGSEPAELLARVESIAPERQFAAGTGFAIARSYSLERPAAASTDWQLVLTAGQAEIAGLSLAISVSPVRRVAADITLRVSAGTNLALPEDVLAVLGWDWARLITAPGGWKTKLRLRGDAGRRTRTAEAALGQVAAHLARTLAGTPADYHVRFHAARWGVFFRRAIPLLTFLFLLIGVGSLAHRGVAAGSELWILFFHVPTVLIAASFCLQELAQYEIPPLPRRPRAPDWSQAQPPLAADADLKTASEQRVSH
jgi:hypothetical protein